MKKEYSLLEAFDDLNKLDEVSYTPRQSSYYSRQARARYDNQQEFWKAAREGKLDLFRFNEGYSNLLWNMIEKTPGVEFEDIFMPLGNVYKSLGIKDNSFDDINTLKDKSCYGAIKKLDEAFPDNWAVKALKKVWWMLFKDNIEPAELIYAKKQHWKDSLKQAILDLPGVDDILKKCVQGERTYDFTIDSTEVYLTHKWYNDVYDEYADLNWHTTEDYWVQAIIKYRNDPQEILSPEDAATEINRKWKAKDYEERTNARDMEDRWTAGHEAIHIY